MSALTDNRGSGLAHNLCTTCAQYDWEYHLHRYEDDRLSADRKLWDEDKNHTLYMPRQDKAGGSYFLAADSTRFYLGTFASVKASSSDCELCCLIVSHVEGDEQNASIADSTERLFCVIRRSIYDYSPVIIGIPDSSLMLRDKPWLPFTIVGDYRDLPRRSIVDNLNVRQGLLRRWFDDCTESHANCRQHSFQQNTASLNLSTFKVIDVETRQVVNAPPNAPYVALSYVWGQAKMYKARKQDFVRHKKRKHGGAPAMVLPLDSIELPKTIEDTLYAVKQLGQRYLWVDALCITQDDPIELQSTLEVMHLVYGNAQLTICAMNGGDAESGLGKLRPGKVSNLELVAHLGDSMIVEGDTYEFPKMKWATRAWTYQESVYSTRCLLFAGDRVLYSCNQGLYSEEREEGITITFGLDPTLPHHRIQRQDWEDSSEANFSKVSPFDEYALHVESFTERELSYQNDVLKAFSAIMSDMATKHDFVFCWGLPTGMFELALCWAPCAGIPSQDLVIDTMDGSDNMVFSNLPMPSVIRRKDFPSWSWTGHKHESTLLYTPEMRSILKTRGSMIKHVVWPWEPQYNSSIDNCVDVFKSGLLDIEVELTTMKKPKEGRSFLSGEDSDDLQFDNFSNWEDDQVKICFRLCEASTTLDLWDPDALAEIGSDEISDTEGDNTTALSVLLTIFLNPEGRYERDGLFVIKSTEWDMQDVLRQRILLR